MVKIYRQPFAHEGDTIAIPDASQPDGKMSSSDGWTPDYQLPKTDPNYKPVGRQEMNGVFKEVTESLGQVQVQGAATWSVDGAPYPVSAQVYHSGKQWIARRANSVEPAEGDDWIEFSAVEINNKLDKSAVVQSTGASITDIMSQKAVSDQLIGVGKTWSNVKATRAWRTEYTNTKGRTLPIAVTVRDGSTSDEGELIAKLFVDSELHSEVRGGYGFIQTLCADIPAGSTYELKRIDNDDVIINWKEL